MTVDYDDLDDGLDEDLKFEPSNELFDTPNGTASYNIETDFPVLKNVIDFCHEDTFENIKVYKNNDLFDKDQTTSWKTKGKTINGKNSQRMATGRAAIGIDNKPINLHHIYQTQNGPIIELLQSFHQANYSALHKNTGQSKSLIDRGTFASWRRRYWQNR